MTLMARFHLHLFGHQEDAEINACTYEEERRIISSTWDRTSIKVLLLGDFITTGELADSLTGSRKTSNHGCVPVKLLHSK